MDYDNGGDTVEKDGILHTEAKITVISTVDSFIHMKFNKGMELIDYQDNFVGLQETANYVAFDLVQDSALD